jgi:diguanylate cyclase (GGDEF)-like protein/PAS domain S-box-containing protein
MIGIKLKQQNWEKHRVLLTSLSVAICVISLRLSGVLQPLEWAALDQFFRSRPLEPVDKRVVIVGIDEEDINQLKQWPISDALLAQVLQKLDAAKPRAIGLDIYRNLSVQPGHDQLVQTVKSIPNIIGIERIQDEKWPAVSPPPMLSQPQQVGFNNMIIDSDRKVRRAVLYWWPGDGKTRKSFAFQLALRYLKTENISTKALAKGSDRLQLGGGILQPLEANDGAYVGVDAKGYQILANYRGPAGRFRTVSISDVLAGKVPADVFRDRIVLIGSTAVSLKDFLDTPYTGGLISSRQSMSAVEIHANFISQILSLALNERPLIQVWHEPVEKVWIVIWSWIGASLSWRVRSARWSALSILLAGAGLTGFCYVMFLLGWWLPVVPPLLTLCGSAVAITAYFANLEDELKKSKEFLYTVINTIPDPIFVKNKEHRWVVLNEAYCRFIGYPYEKLIEKLESDFFPAQEAETFWDQDELVFNTGQEQESEEKFTNAKGFTHLIATKRSLHKDAAGNLFLVGVIRDITERKQIEEDLKRTAAELARSNEELKLSEDRLRHLAYHDTLTGLPNRKLFHERLCQSLERAGMNHQMVALLFLDLDGFKCVNDTLGHEIGDLLLKAVSARLIGCLRGSDTVSRLGGDEFTVILPAIPSIPDAEKVANKILTTLSHPFIIEGMTISVTTSIGISLYPLHAEEIDSLINKADAAMYCAKDLGKNQYHVASFTKGSDESICR